MGTTPQDTLDTFQRGDSVLVLSPTFSETGPSTCGDLTFQNVDSERYVLCVTFTRSPEDHLTDWRRHGTLANNATFVAVDGSVRSNGPRTPGREYDGPDDVEVTVDWIAAPVNLTQLGVRVTNRMESLPDGVADREIDVCFDSVTALLQYVDDDQAFRFFNVLTDRLEEAGARAHFHMDPGAHDDETVEALKTVFDGVVTAENEDR